MSQPVPAHNPFMLMLNPEIVLAAIEKSERLGQLNRHLCRPLDRPAPAGAKTPISELEDVSDEVPLDSDKV
ncbi:MAG: hypothetical protein Q8R98_14595 [Rubrivivax sp.]|nr:hypothetical protein [Rubrivivax sp.]MDP3222866.1 hypothetical protein [Rubrivivax sp.]MDP3613083.1 hypothetical protein [Rubrivivax sp.]